MRNVVFTILLSYTTSVFLAQAPKFSNEFLSIGVGADALGRSGSVVASVEDYTSSYWNPAGLTSLKNDIQVGAMHAEYFAGIAKYDYLGGAFKIDSNASFGASIIRFGIDDIPNTIDLIDANGNVNYDNITSFSTADYAFLLSYARKNIFPGVSIGGSAKIVHRKVGDFAKAWGFGIDLGAQYRKNNWLFGLLARDITTTVNAWSYSLDDRTLEVFNLTDNEIPQNGTEITLPKFILAAGYNFSLKNNIGFTPEINLDFTTDGKRNVLIEGDPVSIDPHLGMQFDYKKIVYLRAGLGNLQRETNDLGNREFFTVQPNMGIGVSLRNVQLDYALTDIGDASAGLYSHVFSLRFNIQKE